MSQIMYFCNYQSPLGAMIMQADENNLIALFFVGQKYSQKYESGTFFTNKRIESKELKINDLAIFRDTALWLDTYFSGQIPSFMPQIALKGSEFALQVWEILQSIPYGKTTTYGAIAKTLANKRGVAKMSAQAVGGAVGRNPISIIIPCHRVLGADNALTGYAGGVDKKLKLLEFEGVNTASLVMPKGVKI